MCELCHGKDGCIPTGKRLSESNELTVEDWDAVYRFWKYIWLPFLHSVIMRARKRQSKERCSESSLAHWDME